MSGTVQWGRPETRNGYSLHTRLTIYTTPFFNMTFA